MTTIENFVDYFLNDNADGKKINNLRIDLNNNLPGWQSIVCDPDNWDALDKIKTIKGDSNAYYHLIFETAGIELLKRWFHHGDKHRKKELASWFCWNLEEWEYFDQDIKNSVMEHYSFLLNILNLSREQLYRIPFSIWNDLTDKYKEIFIESLFEQFPGEPFNSIKEYNRRYYDPFYGRSQGYFNTNGPLYFMGYMTSPEVNIVLSEIKRLKDKKFIRLIETKIKDQKKNVKKSSPIAKLHILRIISIRMSEILYLCC